MTCSANPRYSCCSMFLSMHFDVRNFSTLGCLLGLSGQESPNDTIFIGNLNPVGQIFEIPLRRKYRFFKSSLLKVLDTFSMLYSKMITETTFIHDL